MYLTITANCSGEKCSQREIRQRYLGDRKNHLTDIEVCGQYEAEGEKRYGANRRRLSGRRLVKRECRL
jgi:hypothetical protein